MMTEPETISEVIEVTVRMERRGVSFYERLSREAAAPGARDMFAFLAAQEEKHLGIFRVMLERVADYEPRYAYLGEYEFYLEGVAWRALNGFRKASQEAGASGAEALAAGRQLEEGSIAYYSRLLPRFQGSDRSLVESVIAEEQAHLARLLSMGEQVRF